MGGTIEACCLQPIDVIKTRLQLDKVGKYKGDPAAATTAAVALPQPTAAVPAAAECCTSASKRCSSRENASVVRASLCRRQIQPQ
jgi:hypothetical protein